MKNQILPMHHGAKAQTFRNARELRDNMTPAETKLWEALRNKQLSGLKFRRQHPVSRYILDFYCFKKKLGIELDGGYHSEKTQQFYDKDRTKNLEELGIQIIRFTNEDVLQDLDRVLNKIRETCGIET